MFFILMTLNSWQAVSSLSLNNSNGRVNLDLKFSWDLMLSREMP